MLTTETRYRYTGATELHSGLTAPERLAFFYTRFLGDEKPNILNKARGLCTSVESPTYSNLGGHTESVEKMTNTISIFNFNQNQIRTQSINGEPYFCLRDVCGALDLKNSKDREFNKGVETFYLPTKSGNQNITFINEPNLYRLIFRSNKPQAQAFADWVYNEVLPSIRKTGGYGAPAVDMKAIGGAVKRCAAVAVREELAKLITLSDDVADRQVSDQELLYMLYRWQATRNSADTEKLRKLHAENDELKIKLATIRKAVQ